MASRISAGLSANKNDAAKAAAEAAKRAAAAAARRAAAEAAAKKAAAEAAKKAAQAAAKSAAKDEFKAVKAGAAASVSGKLAAEAKANLKDVSSKLTEASAKLEALPKVSAEAKATAEVAAQVAEQPKSRWGVLGDAVQGLKNKTESLVEQAKTGLGDLAEAAKSKVQEGVQVLESATKKLDEVLDGGVKELKRQTIDQPIDELQPGGKVNLNSEANIGVGIPGLNVGAGGVSIKGKVEQKIEVKAEEDGSYTIKNEINALEAGSIGGTTQRGVDVSADSGAGGGMTTEYKVKPVTVKNADGSDKMVDGKPVIDVEATKAKVKELTSLLVNPPVKPQNPLLMQVKAAEDGRTDAQKALMNESYVATEYKGSLASQVAAEFGVPNTANVKGSVKGSQDLTLRIEKADVPVRDENGKPVPKLDDAGKPVLDKDGKPEFKTQDGVKITTGVTMNSEISGEGSVNANPLVTANGDGKLAAKTTLSTSFEYPGKSDGLSFSDLAKVTQQKPHVTATLSQETDVQLGGGAGVGLDVGVAKGGGRQMERIGATQTTTITIDDPLKNGAEVLQKASEGNLKDAAKVAGDNTKVKIETTVYTERARIAEGGLKIGKIVDLSTKAEAVERRVLTKLPTVDATGTEIATATREQLKKAQEKLEDANRDLNRRPVMIRA